MALFGKNASGGLANEIRCDEPSYLIWKWRPAGSQHEKNRRENAIRWGSSLRVKDGEVAVFVYRQDNGILQDFIQGPYDQILQPANLPVLADMIASVYNGGTPFQAEVYFINLAQIIQVRFGVPFFDVYDPRFGDFGVPVAVRGTISFKISDYRQFIKLHRLTGFQLGDFQEQIKDAVARYIKDVVANAPAENSIPLVQIETKIAQINDVAEYTISERLKESFGVEVSGVDISAVELDKTSDGYARLMAVTKELAAAKAQAETTDYVERLRIEREEGQYAAHKQTQSANISAFRVEKQAEVGMAGAEALGQMGDSGADSVELGGGDGGFHPAAMVAGMALGGAVGQNIAGIMNQSMAGAGTQPMPGAGIPPTPAYHLAVNGQATGPYDMTTLAQMAASDRFNVDSLVWKEGMSQWARAGAVEELKTILGNIPPIPPRK